MCPSKVTRDLVGLVGLVDMSCCELVMQVQTLPRELECAARARFNQTPVNNYNDFFN